MARGLALLSRDRSLCGPGIFREGVAAARSGDVWLLAEFCPASGWLLKIWGRLTGAELDQIIGIFGPDRYSWTVQLRDWHTLPNLEAVECQTLEAAFRLAAGERAALAALIEAQAGPYRYRALEALEALEGEGVPHGR